MLALVNCVKLGSFFLLKKISSFKLTMSYTWLTSQFKRDKKKNICLPVVTTVRFHGVHSKGPWLWEERALSKLNQRLHFLHRLRLHGVNKEMMLLFYRDTDRYRITTWFGNLPVKQKAHLQNLFGWAGKIISMPPPSSLQELFEQGRPQNRWWSKSCSFRRIWVVAFREKV